jgi:hypothetical protein
LRRCSEQKESPSLVDLSEPDRRETELLRKSLDGATGFLVVARDEDDAAASVLRWVASQHRRRQLIESLDHPRAAQLLSDYLRRQPVPQVFARIHRVDDDLAAPVDSGRAGELAKGGPRNSQEDDVCL